MPKISVIVPVYNVEPYIHRCVDSILAQTFTNFELILVDDGSPDNCPAICDEYAEKDDRVHVIHQENGGLSAARNAGIGWVFANSDSEWISFIDGDDWVANNYLQALYQGSKDTKLSVSSCGFLKTKGDVKVEHNEIVVSVVNTEDYYATNRTNFVIACGKLYKKDCFNSIRYPIGKIHEDEFVTYLILFQFHQMAVINSPLYYYQINNNGIMHSKSVQGIVNAIDAINDQLAFFKNHGFDKAYYTSLFHYINTLTYFFDNSDGKKYAIKEIKKCIIKHIFRIDLFIKNVPWACELVFPLFMKIYWKIESYKNND